MTEFWILSKTPVIISDALYTLIYNVFELLVIMKASVREQKLGYNDKIHVLNRHV